MIESTTSYISWKMQLLELIINIRSFFNLRKITQGQS